MKVLFKGEAPLKVLFFFEEESHISDFLKKKKLFEGKEGDFYWQVKDSEIALWVGLGKKSETNFFSLLKTGVLVAKKIAKTQEAQVEFSLLELGDKETFFIAQGFFLQSLFSYSLKEKKEPSFLKETIFKTPFVQLIHKAQSLAQTRNWIRELVDTPSNILTPQSFALQIKEAFKESAVKVEIWDFDRVQKENLTGLNYVGKGSDNPPYFVKLHYAPKGAKQSLSLIGKGITFDSGGLSLKPTDSMLDMKSDMAGAATVAGIFQLALKNNLPIELYGFLPLAENMVSGKAYKVGDIITYNNQKSVEITNTDAEGRLILADALILASNEKPSFMIDIATLTGACMVALGTDIYGVFANNQEEGQKYVDFVNKESSDFAWSLPLFSRYQEGLKSKIADLKNTGKRWGGAISAALFLKEFVDNKKNWMHFDIAGPSFDEGLGLFDGQATGVPLESLYLYLENLAK